MARQNHGPLSRAKGKLGGVVYQQYEGMQISREYQPVVKNPQTTKQTENRAKFKLSSQIVAEFKEVFSARLANLSIYERMRRANAVNAIFGAISTVTPANPQALISGVVNAINAKSMPTALEPTMTFDDNNGMFEITAANGDRVIVVSASYDSNGKFVARKVESFESTGAIKQITPPLGNTYVCMAVAMHSTTEEGRASISNLSATDTAFANTIARAVAAGDVEITNVVGLGGTD